MCTPSTRFARAVHDRVISTFSRGRSTLLGGGSRPVKAMARQGCAQRHDSPAVADGRMAKSRATFCKEMSGRPSKRRSATPSFSQRHRRKCSWSVTSPIAWIEGTLVKVLTTTAGPLLRAHRGGGRRTPCRAAVFGARPVASRILRFRESRSRESALQHSAALDAPRGCVVNTMVRPSAQSAAEKRTRSDRRSEQALPAIDERGVNAQSVKIEANSTDGAASEHHKRRGSLGRVNVRSSDASSATGIEEWSANTVATRLCAAEARWPATSTWRIDHGGARPEDLDARSLEQPLVDAVQARDIPILVRAGLPVERRRGGLPP